MPRNFSFLPAPGAMDGPRFWLQTATISLVVLNAIVLFLYLDPPGGTRRELAQEADQIRSQIASASVQAARQKAVAQKVQLGSAESTDFMNRYILPKRIAYADIISEIQRIAKVSGMVEKDAAYSEEPIEGTADLTLLGSSANYEGTYQNLRKFLFELDRSPFLIMLESLQLAPQQRGNQVNTNIKFQAVIQDDATAAGPFRGQP